MIHPNLATMLAVVTTDYPLEAGEAITFLRPAVARELQRHLGRRRVLDERRRRPALVRRGDVERTPATDTAFALALAHVCSRPLRADRRRRRGRDAARRDQRRGRRDAGEATRDRPAHRDLAARQDGALRARRKLGPRADGGGQRAVQRRVRAGRCVARLALVQRHGRAGRAARRRTQSRTSTAPCARSTSTSGSATAAPRYLTSDLSYDYVRINAEYRS